MVEDMTPFEALELAVDLAGSQSALARICCISPTAVWKWVQSSKRVPAEFVLMVENATGVPRYFLRPDIYPRDLPAAPRWHGIAQCVPVRFRGVDRRSDRVSFKNNDNSKAARA